LQLGDEKAIDKRRRTKEKKLKIRKQKTEKKEE
jgi:hypothetical protein